MLPIPWKIEPHDSLPSTNAHAHTLILTLWQNNKSPHAQVITAKTQSAGRGQHDRTFQSPPGGLYLSAIIESPLENIRPHLALITGVAVATALNNLLPQRIQLRWPNDLILHEKKLGGILCESLAQQNRFASILGIGLNINTPLTDLPEPLRPHATSLLQETQTLHDLQKIQTAILTQLSSTLNLAAFNGLQPIIQSARQLDSLRGKTITLQDGPTAHTGTAAGLSDTGDLLLQSSTSLTSHTTGSIHSINNLPIR